MGCKMPWWAGSETPPPDKDKIIAGLRAEYAALQESVTAKDLLIASLKDEQKLDRQHIANLTELNKEALEINARHMAEYRDLTQQLANLKEEFERVERQAIMSNNAMDNCFKERRNLTQQLAAANGRVERMRRIESRPLHALACADDEPKVDRRMLYFYRMGWNQCRDAALSDLPYEVPSFDERSSEADKEQS